MDDMSRQKSGIYLEFINRVKDYYDYRGKSMGTCYWYPTSLAFEPHIGQEILVSMVNDARRKGVIDFYMNSEIVEVKKNRRTVGIFGDLLVLLAARRQRAQCLLQLVATSLLADPYGLL